jgi:formylglycine-generating enzyme required for sulfatase activity
MPIASGRPRLRRALALACGAAVLLVVAALAGPGAAAGSTPAGYSPASVVTITTVRVGAPGNPSVGVVPFTDAVYRSCASAPQSSRGCVNVGKVAYPYQIGRLEVTVRQWVTFLNTADASGRDPHDLYSPSESSSAWPRYGQINFSATAGRGRHYTVAYPQWAGKPYGFATFLQAARFVNALYNGRLIAKRSSGTGVTYTVALSPRTERGMYDVSRGAFTRSHATGFVVPSQNEWIKAAYYDPRHGGTYSYWKYPTNPGVFGDGDATAPHTTVLNGGTRDVTNAPTQPLASYHQSGQPAPAWCPSQVPATACTTVNPLGLSPAAYAKVYQGSLSTVGQARTPSPWGTLDQGGNAVEWTDTITAAPAGQHSVRVWRRLHGGISNAPAFQMWPSAVGLQPQDNTLISRTYPWLGFRIGVVGDLVPHRP